MSEHVIELSVDETNKLRAELGLAPLRGVDTGGNQPPPRQPASTAVDAKHDDDAVLLELSVDDTNALRERLGLAPLKSNSLSGPGSGKNSSEVSSSTTTVLHTPAVNEMNVKETKERIERARLQRQVELGIQTQFAAESLGSTNDTRHDAGAAGTADAKVWAQQMLSSATNISALPDVPKKKSRVKSRRPAVSAVYDDSDLTGLTVGHAVADLADGSTVLTLADTPLLKTQSDISRTNVDLNDAAEPVLENVNLVESQRVQTGLRDKRKLELSGLDGRGGGWDDDEFLELDGTQAPSRGARGSGGAVAQRNHGRGFQIGDATDPDAPTNPLSSLLGSNQAISLESSQSNVVTASDFMTIEEDEAMQSLAKKEKKAKFKKDKKKDRKRSKRRSTESDEEDERPAVVAKKSLIEELEQTADVRSNVTARKRRRDDTSDTEGANQASGETELPSRIDSKRAKYDQVMAKGNERSEQVFGAVSKVTTDQFDEEPDDAFLNAALAKARRLNKLKEMSQRKKSSADTVVAAIQANAEAVPSSAPSGTITFAVDETREFTRALLARTEQSERDVARRNVKKESSTNTAPTAEDVKSGTVATVAVKEEETEDIHELAKLVKVEDTGVMDGAMGQSNTIGRGVGSIISLLQQTGEITRKHAGKEEMRGRAKDKRTYEDYEPLDLANVVKINQNKAHDKDKELAQREIKLEYRDKHGRLLTRKEAYRDLSYQFHGYGSGKRKEEKKLEQIARERAETRLASQQASDGIGAGTFGALKATQKASGKAFVVHKTGT